jgi:hypothetical protein
VFTKRSDFQSDSASGIREDSAMASMASQPLKMASFAEEKPDLANSGSPTNQL